MWTPTDDSGWSGSAAQPLAVIELSSTETESNQPVGLDAAMAGEGTEKRVISTISADPIESVLLRITYCVPLSMAVGARL
jgi:hypothetical protein